MKPARSTAAIVIALLGLGLILLATQAWNRAFQHLRDKAADAIVATDPPSN